MSRYVFLFDLDSTITRQEILPTIAKKVGKYKEMRVLTENTMSGEIPFKESFIKRVELLKNIPISDIQMVVENIKLNEKLVEFIQDNKERCYIVTGNLDVWIINLMKKIGMENNLFSSKAIAADNYLKDVVSIVDKKAVIQQMVSPFVAVGDGNNDAEMIYAADMGIGYGGVRQIAPSVIECATHAIYQEDTLVRFLNKLV